MQAMIFQSCRHQMFTVRESDVPDAEVAKTDETADFPAGERSQFATAGRHRDHLRMYRPHPRREISGACSKVSPDHRSSIRDFGVARAYAHRNSRTQGAVTNGQGGLMTDRIADIWRNRYFSHGTTR